MYARQSIDQNDIEAVAQALKGELITRGPQVEAFEQGLKELTGASYCVVMNSGSSALEGAYFAAEANSADRLITTPNTFVSTIGRGVERGMTPVFIDIDPSTGNLLPELLKENLDFQSTRGRLFVVPVHFAGIAVDMKAINEALKNPDAVVIEDAAHAIGSHYPSGEKVGSCAYSDMTVLSFHPAKTITTGEGGAVLTNDETLYQKLLDFRNNGIRRKSHWEYDCVSFSGNYHMNEMQAALGSSQLKRLDKFVEKRRALVKRYRENLKGVEGITLFSAAPDDYTAYHLMVLQIDMERFKTDRSTLIQQLKENNVGTQFHYIPLYRHPVLANAIGDLSSYFPNMEKYFQEALSFPLYYDLGLEEVDEIVHKLKKVLKI